MKAMALCSCRRKALGSTSPTAVCQSPMSPFLLANTANLRCGIFLFINELATSRTSGINLAEVLLAN